MNDSSPSSSLFTKRNIFLATVGSIVLFGGLAFYFHQQAITSDPQKVAQEEARQLVATVGKLMILPAGEQPIIATVADPSKLTDQPFFANSQKGDKVLIYNSAHKAILFRPSANLVIDVAPLSIGTPAPK